MPKRQTRTPFGEREGELKTGVFKQAVVAGDSAGDIAVTGIDPDDELIGVTQFIGGGTDVTDVADLTSEFSISAADTINNDGGTDTTGDKLLVTYIDRS